MGEPSGGWWPVLLLAGSHCGCSAPNAPGSSTAGTDGVGPSDSAPSSVTDGDSASHVGGAGDTAGGGEDTAAGVVLRINEFMPDNAGAVVDAATGTAPDWFELYNPGAEAIELGGYLVSDDWTEPDQHVLDASLRIEAGGTLLLWADGDPEAGVDHVGFSLSAGGEAFGIFAPDGTSLDWVGYPATTTGYSRARMPDGADVWVAMPVGTPGASNTTLSLTELSPVAAGATWAYQDAGVDLGDDWRDPDYDDSGWSTGPGPLGFGDTHQLTAVGYGDDPNAKNPTTYFRLSFQLEGITDEGLRSGDAALGLLVDDGAVVWLNGAEAARDNIGTADVAYDTLAEAAVSGGDESDYEALVLDTSLLLLGRNTLAVEVHQASATSSDLGFDLTLSASILVRDE